MQPLAAERCELTPALPLPHQRWIAGRLHGTHGPSTKQILPVSEACVTALRSSPTENDALPSPLQVVTQKGPSSFVLQSLGVRPPRSTIRRKFSVHVHALPQVPPSRLRAAWTSFRQRRLFSTAFYVVLAVLRNVIGCVLCALFANFCYSLGNIFTLRVSTHQSTESIIVASLVWTNVLYCGITLVTYSTTLQSQRFITIPEMPPSLRFCIKKLARATCGYYAVSVFLIFAWGVLVANTFPVTWRWMRLDFYAGAIVNHIFTAAIARATKRTYDHETFAKLLARVLTDISQGAVCHVYWRIRADRKPEPVVPARCIRGADICDRELRDKALAPGTHQGVCDEAQYSPDTRHVRPRGLADRTHRHSGAHCCARRAEHGLCERRDAGKMALIEIVLRAGKMVLIKWQIRRRVAAVLRACFNSQVSSGRSSSGRHSSQSSLEQVCDFMTFSGEFVDTRAKLTRWKQQMLDFHTAEVMADMYAEYIAIACSASILFFFFDHPKYHLGSGTTASKVAQLQRLLVSQLGLEIVVNCVSCVCEIAGGVHFERVRKFNVFLAFMFKTITVVNIGISSFLYLK